MSQASSPAGDTAQRREVGFADRRAESVHTFSAKSRHRALADVMSAFAVVDRHLVGDGRVLLVQMRSSAPWATTQYRRWLAPLVATMTISAPLVGPVRSSTASW